jgi:hypothetical protein
MITRLLNNIGKTFTCYTARRRIKDGREIALVAVLEGMGRRRSPFTMRAKKYCLLYC